jgi:hypothetical protein
MIIYAYHVTINRSHLKNRYILYSHEPFPIPALEVLFGLHSNRGIIGHTIRESRHQSISEEFKGPLVIETDPIQDPIKGTY